MAESSLVRTVDEAGRVKALLEQHRFIISFASPIQNQRPYLQNVSALNPFGEGEKVVYLWFRHHHSRTSGVADAFWKWMEMREPFRTLLTSAGRKQARQVPPVSRTLG